MLKWLSSSLADAVGRILLKLVTTVVFAYWLSPEIFGRASLTIVIVSLLAIVVTAPFEESLVQRRVISRSQFAGALALVLAGSLVCLVLIALARDAPAAAPQATTARTAADAEADRATRRSENALMRWLFGVNALNGIAIGLVGPLMTYWFAVRFGRGPADIGPVMALAYGVTAVSSLFAGRLVDRIGVVRAVVWMRSLGVAILLGMGMPTSGIYVLLAALVVPSLIESGVHQFAAHLFTPKDIVVAVLK